MYTKADVDKLLEFSADLVETCGAPGADILDKWGIRYPINAMMEIRSDPPMGADEFLKSWFRMLQVNLESAVWLTVYNHSRLTSMTQKDAMKLADEVLKKYQKGY